MSLEHSPARQRRRSIKTTEPKPTADIAIATTDIATVEPDIEYEDGVNRGRAIVVRLERDWWLLCALAVRVKPKYREQTHKRFFADIGFPGGERRLSVYGAWRPIIDSWAGTSAPGPNSVPFTVLKVLQSHPDRAELLKSNPTMKKEGAVKIMCRFSKKEKATSDGRRKDMERALRALVAAAKTAKDLELKPPTDGRLLKELSAKYPELAKGLANLRDSGDSIYRSADFYDHLDDYIAATAAPDNAREAARESFAQKRAKVAQALKQSADDRKADNAAACEEETVP